MIPSAHQIPFLSCRSFWRPTHQSEQNDMEPFLRCLFGNEIQYCENEAKSLKNNGNTLVGQSLISSNKGREIDFCSLRFWTIFKMVCDNEKKLGIIVK